MKQFLFITSIFFCFFSSCTDGPTQGCTDPLAINYESWADENDGSCLYQCEDPVATNYQLTWQSNTCTYEADVVFYLDVSAAVEFTKLNIDYLDLYVENEYIESLPTSTGFTETVLCDDTDEEPIYYTFVWFNSREEVMTWTIRDGTGYIHYEGNDLLLANNCFPFEITWSNIQAYKQNK